jgi:splicing factor 3A subunit 3
MNQIRKKQTRTYEEMEAENYNNQEYDDDKSESDEDGPIYNPKNLPLGWDGK